MANYKKHNYGVSCSLEDKDIYKIKQARDGSAFYEIPSYAKYACVYLLDKKSKYAFIYGCSGSFCPTFKKDLTTMDFHKKAHAEAFAGKKVMYEWFFGTDSATFCQSTLVPLNDEKGEVSGILGIVGILDETLALKNKNFAVAEGASGRGLIHLMINAREEEKRQISSALHDEIGSAAVMINSLLGILEQDILEGKKNSALENVKNVQEAVTSSIARIRRVIVNLRPPQIAEVGLNSAVKEFLDNLSRTVRLKFDYKYNVSEDAELSDTVKITLYRIVQESINNVLKHARAKNVKITFSEDGGNIFLEVKDDGIGYSEEQHRKVNSLGILGMKESISHLGGKIKIEGAAGKGTIVSVLCPKISYARKL